MLFLSTISNHVAWWCLIKLFYYWICLEIFKYWNMEFTSQIVKSVSWNNNNSYSYIAFFVGNQVRALYRVYICLKTKVHVQETIYIQFAFFIYKWQIFEAKFNLLNSPIQKITKWIIMMHIHKRKITLSLIMNF